MPRKKANSGIKSSGKILTVDFVKSLFAYKVARDHAVKAYEAAKARAIKALKGGERPPGRSTCPFRLTYSEFDRHVTDYEGEAEHWRSQTRKVLIQLAKLQGKANPAKSADSYLRRHSFSHPEPIPTSRFTVSEWVEDDT